MRYSLFLRDESLEMVDMQTATEASVSVVSVPWETQAIESLLGALDPSAGLVLILDFSEESLHDEWVPKLLPWERPALEKRLKNRFEKGTLVHAHWLPIFRKNPEGRSEQLILFANVPHSSKLNTLLDTIEAYGLALRRIYSYAFLVETWFLKRLSKRMGLNRQLLKRPFILTFRETQRRFRQLVFMGARLRMSRRIELEEVKDAQVIAALSDETEAILRYLYNQKWWPFQHEVGQIYLSAYESDVSNIQNEMRTSWIRPDWNPSQIPLGAESFESLGIAPSAADDDRSLMGLVQFLKRSAPPSFYWSPYSERLERFWLWNRTVWLLWAVTALLGAYVFMQSAIDYYVLTDKNDRIAQQQHRFEQEKQRLQGVIDLQYDAEDMKATVEFFDRLKQVKQRNSVEQGLVILSRVLTQYPDIELRQLRWKRQSELDNERMFVTLSGYVQGTQGYEALLQKVDAFKAALAAIDQVEKLEYEDEPLNRNEAQALSVEGHLNQKRSRLPFRLRFYFKLFDPQIVLQGRQ